MTTPFGQKGKRSLRCTVPWGQDANRSGQRSPHLAWSPEGWLKQVLQVDLSPPLARLLCAGSNVSARLPSKWWKAQWVSDGVGRPRTDTLTSPPSSALGERLSWVLFTDLTPGGSGGPWSTYARTPLTRELETKEGRGSRYTNVRGSGRKFQQQICCILLLIEETLLQQMPLAYQSSPLNLGTAQDGQKSYESSPSCSFPGPALIPLTPGPKLLSQFAFPSSLFVGCSGRLSFPVQASCLGLCPRCSLQKEQPFSKDPISISDLILMSIPWSLPWPPPPRARNHQLFSLSHSLQDLPEHSLLLSATSTLCPMWHWYWSSVLIMWAETLSSCFCEASWVWTLLTVASQDKGG